MRSPISCAYEHTIATDAQGNVWGWGKNDVNQLGIKTSSRFCKSPQRIDGVPPIHSVSCGLTHVAAIDLNKNVWTWGWNHYGQLGYDSQTCSEPRKIENLPTIFDVACGGNHTIALDENGCVWSWGLNSVNQLGYNRCTMPANNTYCSIPVLVQNLPTSIISTAAGGNCSAAIDSSHSLWVWGSHARSWDCIDSEVCLPRKIPTDSPIIFVSCGLTHAVAIDIDYNLYSWGENNYGQLGLGDFFRRGTERKTIPTRIFGLPRIIFVACSETATTAIDLEGKLWVWGKIFVNRRSGTSASSSFSSAMPVLLDVPKATKFQYISCGTYHIVGIDENEDVWSWGENDRGQLGLGHTKQQNKPQQVELM